MDTFILRDHLQKSATNSTNYFNNSFVKFALVCVENFQLKQAAKLTLLNSTEWIHEFNSEVVKQLLKIEGTVVKFVLKLISDVAYFRCVENTRGRCAACIKLSWSSFFISRVRVLWQRKENTSFTDELYHLLSIHIIRVSISPPFSRSEAGVGWFLDERTDRLLMERSGVANI